MSLLSAKVDHRYTENESYDEINRRIGRLEAEKITLDNTNTALRVENQNLCIKIVELERKLRDQLG